MASLTYSDGVYVFKGTFAEKDMAKQARFKWHPVGRYWWTDDDRRAAQLVAIADSTCRKRLEERIKQAEEAIVASRATDADVDLPRPDGLDYLPYQRAGIAYAAQRENTLIADEMGLGKTIQAIGVANVVAADRILVICPASLRLNWQRELKKWLVKPLSIGVADGKYWPSHTDVVVINFDIVEKHRENIDKVDWCLLVVDEAHYLKSEKARRTCAVMGGNITRKTRSNAA